MRFASHVERMGNSEQALDGGEAVDVPRLFAGEGARATLVQSFPSPAWDRNLRRGLRV